MHKVLQISLTAVLYEWYSIFFINYYIVLMVYYKLIHLLYTCTI